MNSQPATDVAARLAQFLSPERVEHSRNVADLAAALAREHAPRLEQQAYFAGLLHDSAKQMRPPEMLSQADELGLEVSELERRMPALLHGKVGAALLPERFGIDDAEVTRAVSDHVTGRPGMGQLSMILYVADQAAAGRDFPGVEDLRGLMHQSLPHAVRWVATRKIEQAVHRGRLLDPRTVGLYNELTQQPEAGNAAS